MQYFKLLVQSHRHRTQTLTGNSSLRKLDHLVDEVRKWTHYMEKSEAEL